MWKETCNTEQRRVGRESTRAPKSSSRRTNPTEAVSSSSSVPPLQGDASGVPRALLSPCQASPSCQPSESCSVPQCLSHPSRKEPSPRASQAQGRSRDCHDHISTCCDPPDPLPRPGRALGVAAPLLLGHRNMILYFSPPVSPQLSPSCRQLQHSQF